LTKRSLLLLVHPSDELYGSDRVLLEIVNQVPEDVPTEVWLPDDLDYPDRLLSRALAQRGVRVRRVPVPVLRRAYVRAARVPWLLARTARCAHRLVRLRPRAVYLNTTACLLLAPVARLVGARVSVHVHESWGGMERRLLGPLLLFAHQTVAVSAAVHELLPARARTRVVYNGLPAPADVVPPPGKERPLTFLVASRWSRWKGHETLLAAWDRLDVDARLVVLGGPPPIGGAIDVPGLVKRLRRPDTVEVVGEVRNIGPWLRRADCVVVPSVTPDPLPTIAIEAAAYARALIGSRCGGLPEIVDDGVTGVLVSPGDVDGLAHALSMLTPERARTMGSRARDVFEERFSADRFAVEIREVLDALVTE
jgi:glycosyltransferase involved in cell wall biosynthesis